MSIETSLTFENPEDNSALQVEMDTTGYSLTIFDADGSIASMMLDDRSLTRLASFINTLDMENIL